ncbi:hypothetical protein DV20_38505 [Amycolatopsis rifamycinica]|uniref:Uncharacterized protein n=1 Tax=Amycolatopsis rifamycinica TaxID=287986 RepID=A0A066TYN1_9PSEU|nr:hypothetical protein DV20_38505 [Amycolatopsis rifamycinica]
MGAWWARKGSTEARMPVRAPPARNAATVVRRRMPGGAGVTAAVRYQRHSHQASTAAPARVLISWISRPTSTPVTSGIRKNAGPPLSWVKASQPTCVAAPRTSESAIQPGRRQVNRRGSRSASGRGARDSSGRLRPAWKTASRTSAMSGSSQRTAVSSWVRESPNPSGAGRNQKRSGATDPATSAEGTSGRRARGSTAAG